MENADGESNHLNQMKLEEELNRRMKADQIFEQFSNAVGADTHSQYPVNYDCLKALVNTVEHSCGTFDDYTLKYVKVLSQACNTDLHYDLLQHNI